MEIGLHPRVAGLLVVGCTTGPRDGRAAAAPSVTTSSSATKASETDHCDPGIYQIAHGPHYRRAFHDITTGNNTVQFPPRTITGYRAAPGWDPVTGWGSPDAQILVPLLARYASP